MRHHRLLQKCSLKERCLLEKQLWNAWIVHPLKGTDMSVKNKASMTVDVGEACVVVRLQFSESTAQEVTKCLRKKDFAGGLRASAPIKSMLLDCIGDRRVGLTVKGMEVQQRLGGSTLEKLLASIVGVSWTSTANYFRNSTNEFICATQNPADGVVMFLEFSNIPFLEQLRTVRQDIGGFPLLTSLVPKITIFAGAKR